MQREASAQARRAILPLDAWALIAPDGGISECRADFDAEDYRTEFPSLISAGWRVAPVIITVLPEGK